MSSAETTHAVEWKSDGVGGESIRIGHIHHSIWPSEAYEGMWMAGVRVPEAPPSTWVRSDISAHPTASAARSFVEKSVKEAGR